MSEAFEVTPKRPREATVGQRAAQRLARLPAPPADAGEVVVVPRTVRLGAVLDVLGALLIIGGLAVGDVAAWMAGGTVPGLATLGGALIAAGFVLAYR